jgi:hypothetical protein
MVLYFIIKNRVIDKDTNWKWEKPAKNEQKNQVPIFFAHFASPLRSLRDIFFSQRPQRKTR